VCVCVCWGGCGCGGSVVVAVVAVVCVTLNDTKLRLVGCLYKLPRSFIIVYFLRK